MIFKTFPIDETEGCLLAHTVRSPDWVIKKGTRLDKVRIDQLRKAGIAQVAAARLAADDVPEDKATLSVAEKLAGEGTSVMEPQTGRCNIAAGCHGVAVINPDIIDAFNLSGNGVMVSTLAPFEVVDPDRIVATVKVIPYAVPGKELEAQLAVISEPAILVKPFQASRAGLVLTRSYGMKEGLFDKARQTMSERLEAWGGELVRVEQCDHDRDAVAAIIQEMGEDGYDLILAMGATSPSDAADVVPAAIVRAGGDLEQVGMPVEPGNMMVLGKLGQAHVMGLPGCARSQCLNGIDLVLPRLMAGLPVDSDELKKMGVGGLL